MTGDQFAIVWIDGLPLWASWLWTIATTISAGGFLWLAWQVVKPK